MSRRYRTIREAVARIAELEDDVRNLESVIESQQEIYRIQQRLLSKYRIKADTNLRRRLQQDHRSR